MGNYEEAKNFVGACTLIPCPANHIDMVEGRLLEKEPSNLQAQSLSGLIEDRATRGESTLKYFQTLADASS